jgi:hypothetical protein
LGPLLRIPVIPVMSTDERLKLVPLPANDVAVIDRDTLILYIVRDGAWVALGPTGEGGGATPGGENGDFQVMSDGELAGIAPINVRMGPWVDDSIADLISGLEFAPNGVCKSRVLGISEEGAVRLQIAAQLSVINVREGYDWVLRQNNWQSWWFDVRSKNPPYGQGEVIVTTADGKTYVGHPGQLAFFFGQAPNSGGASRQWSNDAFLASGVEGGADDGVDSEFTLTALGDTTGAYVMTAVIGNGVHSISTAPIPAGSSIEVVGAALADAGIAPDGDNDTDPAEGLHLVYSWRRNITAITIDNQTDGEVNCPTDVQCTLPGSYPIYVTVDINVDAIWD